jgi:hypothetical protein
MLRRLVFALAMLPLSTLIGEPGRATDRSGVCLTTLPPNPPFIPPVPYPPNAQEGEFWYGSDALWTTLLLDGVWRGWDKDQGYVQKLVWWRRGFDWRKEMEPKLIITGTRLDGDAPSIAVAHANAVFVTGPTPAMMTGINIPTPGCWELTGHYRGHTLTYVVSVVP